MLYIVYRQVYFIDYIFILIQQAERHFNTT